MELNGIELPWFALQARPRYEQRVSSALRAKGYEEYLPLYRSRRAWSDRIKELDLPLFPGYLFCRFNPHQRLPILITPGVIGVVGTATGPIPVDQAEIARVRTIVGSGLSAEPWNALAIGQTVRISIGPLRGLEGVLVELKKQTRLVVGVTLLQRSVAVDIDQCWVESTVPSTPLRMLAPEHYRAGAGLPGA